MGLDMYLNKRIYIGAEFKHRNISGIIDIKEGEKPIQIDFNKVSEIVERAGYWRKANQIHKWFVENVQDGEDDCREHYVEKKKRKELYNLCVSIRDKKAQPEEVLPTQSGFFFGSTEIDEYYMQDVNDTIAILEPTLEDDHDFYYQSSW
jgi:hypothetical protein